MADGQAMIYQYHPSLAWWLELARQAAPGVGMMFGGALAFTLAIWAGVEIVWSWRKR